MSQHPMSSRPVPLWMQQWADAKLRTAQGHVASRCGDPYCASCRAQRARLKTSAPAESEPPQLAPVEPPPAEPRRGPIDSAIAAFFGILRYRRGGGQ